MKLAIVAIGGNALITDLDNITVESEYRAAGQTTHHIANMIADGWRVVIVHGNGPQVGFNLRRSELARGELFELPLDVCGTFTQGSIGYYFQQNLRNQLRELGIQMPVVTVISQVLVDAEDHAFDRPTKPIGMFMEEEDARHVAETGWTVMEDAGRGWRRVVASPKPIRIIEERTIQQLLDSGSIVIALGGGGIPVVMDEKGYISGAMAVIDKDFSAALLAKQLKADLLLISTSVEKVALDFGTPNERWLDQITAAEARQYLEEGHFAEGSMKPKIEAIVQYVEATGHEGLITSPFSIDKAMHRKTGTWIVP
ncbi:MAG: carbamate kinase [Ardenticatenaceae bacterium]|nr:carbamate kinase [Ardenticatenaceae bacterium]